jgi:flagellar hook assembly protein FlgD
VLVRPGRAVRVSVAAVVLSLSVIGSASAAFAVAPGTVPVVTAPADAAVVGAVVPLTATSTAESVQFEVNAVALGSPVAVTGGVASTSWETFGLDQGASYAITAADCNVDGCGSSSPPATVTVSNAAPVLVAPGNGTAVGANTTLSATVAGGAVAFWVDGNNVGVDTTAPFDVPVTSLSSGTHNVYAQGCNASGTTCAGPASPTNTFTVIALHPTIWSISPSPFSPNADGRRDSTTTTFSLTDNESVSYEVTSNATGLIVRGPRSLGPLAAGTHTHVWLGVDNASHRVPDGTYTYTLRTSRGLPGGGRALGVAQHSVTVDVSTPVLSNVSGSNAKFYPYPDGYYDTFAPAVTVSQAATLSLYIETTGGSLVRRMSVYHSAAGRFSLSWDGKNTAGSRVAAGAYLFVFRAEDIAGNRRTSGKYTVTASAKRLITKSTAITLNGDQGDIESSDWSCTGYSYGLSTFDHGVWLANNCDPSLGTAAIFGDYSFTVPAAVRYYSVKVASYGNTISAPEQIGGLIYIWSANDWDAAVVSLNSDDVDGWSTYATWPGAGHISSGRVVRVAIGVLNENPPEDYDIGLVRIIVNYAVLG